MAKIILFPDNRDKYHNITVYLQESIRLLEEEKAVNCIIAAKTEDGKVITGYYNCDFCERQELLGHIQCDIIDQMIKVNHDRY